MVAAAHWHECLVCVTDCLQNAQIVSSETLTEAIPPHVWRMQMLLGNIQMNRLTCALPMHLPVLESVILVACNQHNEESTTGLCLVCRQLWAWSCKLKDRWTASSSRCRGWGLHGLCARQEQLCHSSSKRNHRFSATCPGLPRPALPCPADTISCAS